MRWPDALDGWPLAEHSRRVVSPPHRWHVQEFGSGPLLLFLHGAGGASHSWRALLPLLSHKFHIVALDLPGHGLTQLGTRSRSGLTPMSEDALSLCTQEGWAPIGVVGHSAGGAVALRMSQLAPTKITRVIGINPALQNFQGLAAIAFPVLAKMLSVTPFVPDFFAGSAKQAGRVETLLGTTGSRIDAQGIELYRQLVADRDHVNGALLMMSQWSLKELIKGLDATFSDVLFLIGEKDGTVPPQTAHDAARQLPHATCQSWPYGHLMHEEAPTLIAEAIEGWLS